MDPQAAWTHLLDALARRELPVAVEPAEALADWTRGGGFPPRTLVELPQDDLLQHVIAVADCDHVLHSSRPRHSEPT